MDTKRVSDDGAGNIIEADIDSNGKVTQKSYTYPTTPTSQPNPGDKGILSTKQDIKSNPANIVTKPAVKSNSADPATENLPKKTDMSPMRNQKEQQLNKETRSAKAEVANAQKLTQQAQTPDQIAAAKVATKKAKVDTANATTANKKFGAQNKITSPHETAARMPAKPVPKTPLHTAQPATKPTTQMK